MGELTAPHPNGPRRQPALGVRRDIRGAVPDLGFRYLRAEDAADRFADRAPGYTYSRVANPTVRMFEERLALLEGAEEAAATATGMPRCTPR